MKKQRFFVITRKGKYSNEDLLWFSVLDKAMEMFRVLIEGETVELAKEEVPLLKKKKDDWRSEEDLYYIKNTPEYHLESRIIEVYTLEEIEKIRKERSKK